jgi:hypothetical protein
MVSLRHVSTIKSPTSMISYTCKEILVRVDNTWPLQEKKKKQPLTHDA